MNHDVIIGVQLMLIAIIVIVICNNDVLSGISTSTFGYWFSTLDTGVVFAILPTVVMGLIWMLNSGSVTASTTGGTKNTALVPFVELQTYKKITGLQMPTPVIKTIPKLQYKIYTKGVMEHSMGRAPYVYIRDARGYPMRVSTGAVPPKAHKLLLDTLTAMLKGHTVDVRKLDQYNMPSSTFKFVRYGDVYFHNGTTPLLNKHLRIYRPLHWGQRKLLMSEIDFLVRCPKRRTTLLYPGSAHGTHLFILLDLFPYVNMMLWDPARYDQDLILLDRNRRGLLDSLPDHLHRYRNRIAINPELEGSQYDKWHHNSNVLGDPSLNFQPELGFFTKKSIEWVLSLKLDTQLLLISDIRLVDNDTQYMLDKVRNLTNPYNPWVTNLSTKLANKDYERDMQLQKKWFEDVKADYALMKMRPPDIDAETSYVYLKGTILLQCWAPIPSGETRLFVTKNAGLKTYDLNAYWEHMGFLQRGCRMADYRNVEVAGIPLENIWHVVHVGYDAWLETDIWARYLGDRVSKNTLRNIITDTTALLLHRTAPLGVDDTTRPLSSKLMYRFKHRLDYQSRYSDNTI
jgi:hypothetical protein